MAILYGFTRGAQRDLPEDAEVNEENLRATACREASPAASRPRSPRAISKSGRLQEDELLRGFGTNGGEEYLSYMQTSEALAIEGGDAWDKMRPNRFSALTTEPERRRRPPSSGQEGRAFPSSARASGAWARCSPCSA